MKAITFKNYGPIENCKIDIIEKPTPKKGEVLIKMKASSVNYGNVAHIKGTPILARLWTGLFKPNKNIPGGDIAGIVEAIGEGVTQYKPGDEVFGDVSDFGFGTYAEYICAPEKSLVHKSPNVSFENAAAATQSGVVALQGLQQANIQSGQDIMIYGASGGIGTFAVQIAKALGAHVTGVCSTRNIDLVKSTGSDSVIDYTKEDFLTSGKQYDVILSTAGFRSIHDYKKALKPKGRYVTTGGDMRQIFQPMYIGPFISSKKGKHLSGLIAKSNQDDLKFMMKLIETGKVKPIIDKTFTLDQAIEAMQYYDMGKAQGKVIIEINQ